MKFFKKQLLPWLLVLLFVLSAIPATVLATAESATVSSQADLIAAIEAIPEGGSGEITIKDVYMYMNEGLYFENKDITFNLVNSSLVTAAGENGSGMPVIFGFGANITINIDDSSSVQAMGHTGNMGVVRIDNSTDWNETSQAFEKNFTLTVNGGQYTCSDIVPEGYDEPDSVFVAASGT